MSVTVQISIAARAGLAAVTAETAGYFVLAAVDQVEGATGRLSSVHLSEDGAIVMGRLGDGDPTDLESDLRALLLRLLGPGSSRAPALTRAAQPGQGRGLARLASELEAALIPVNRSAARRALSRLHRDVARAKSAGKLAHDLAPAESVAAPVSEAPRLSSSPTVRAPAVPPPEAAPIAAAPTPAPVSSAPGAPAPEPMAFVSQELMASVAPEPPPSPSAAPSFLVTQTPLVPDAAWIARGPDATPFLGSWGAVAPVPRALFVPEPGEHDTERQPPVSFDPVEELTPAPEETLTVATAELALAPVVAAPVPAAIASPVPDAPVPDAIVELASAAIPIVAPALEPVVELASEAIVAPASDAIVEAEPNPEPDGLDVAVMHALQDAPPDDAPDDRSEPDPIAVAPVASEEPPIAVSDEEASHEVAASDEPEPTTHAPAAAEMAPVEPSAAVIETAASPELPAPPPEPVYAVYHPRKSDVADLVAGFAVAESLSLAELSRDLKRLAGVGTPCPPAVAMDSVSQKPSLAR